MPGRHSLPQPHCASSIFSGGYVRNAYVCGVFVRFGPSADGVPAGTSSAIVVSGANGRVERNASQRPSCSSFFAFSTRPLMTLFFSISAAVSNASGYACEPAVTLSFASTFAGSIF